MQYTQNNPYSNQSGENPGLLKDKKFVFAVVAIIIMLLVIFLISNRKKPAGSYGEYYDKGSKQTVSNPKGKTPENNGDKQFANQPVYLGISKLIDFGVSTDQLGIFKDTLVKYSPTSKEFSVYVDTVNSIPVERGGRPTVMFDLLVNRESKVTAQLEYFGSTSIRLTLKDKTNKQVFDSGDIDAAKTPSTQSNTSNPDEGD